MTLPIDLYFAKYDRIRNFLLAKVPRKAGAPWVEMLLLMIRLGSRSGLCFPSARFVATHGMLSRRTFWRMISWLYTRGLVEVIAGWRLNGRQSSNQYDFSALVKLIKEKIGEALLEFERSAWKFRQAWARAKEAERQGQIEPGEDQTFWRRALAAGFLLEFTRWGKAPA